ncbi:hypothetical protein KBTX_02747 [wastewater metagenome]|uniref:Uncharacterized protein n=2 Tax=unclassified sequences TaxID=12908 RepID=A0A5B8RBA4_9ZZZZ|nr:hypothetical protein KBTEX_02747 [uncultured organism]
MASTSDLDPWRVICARLFELSSHDIPEVLERTGLIVDWSLDDRQDYSHTYRKRAYRPRINTAYHQLGEEDRLRVANITASELVDRGKGDELDADLHKIGWRMYGGRLTPTTAEVSELFFPVGTQYDAYVEIRRILQKATTSLNIVDPYVDSSLFVVLATIAGTPIQVRLLTYKLPSDFVHEARIFLQQHNNIRLSVRWSKEFHDRFIIVDNEQCWHVGASIKDAGIRVFMLNEVEDSVNRAALISQLDQTWTAANEVSI